MFEIRSIRHAITTFVITAQEKGEHTMHEV